MPWARVRDVWAVPDTEEMVALKSELREASQARVLRFVETSLPVELMSHAEQYRQLFPLKLWLKYLQSARARQPLSQLTGLIASPPNINSMGAQVVEISSEQRKLTSSGENIPQDQGHRRESLSTPQTDISAEAQPEVERLQ